jgi:hypothetical protein
MQHKHQLLLAAVQILSNIDQDLDLAVLLVMTEEEDSFH